MSVINNIKKYGKALKEVSKMTPQEEFKLWKEYAEKNGYNPTQEENEMIRQLSKKRRG